MMDIYDDSSTKRQSHVSNDSFPSSSELQCTSSCAAVDIYRDLMTAEESVGRTGETRTHHRRRSVSYTDEDMDDAYPMMDREMNPCLTFHQMAEKATSWLLGEEGFVIPKAQQKNEVNQMIIPDDDVANKPMVIPDDKSIHEAEEREDNVQPRFKLRRNMAFSQDTMDRSKIPSIRDEEEEYNYQKYRAVLDEIDDDDDSILDGTSGKITPLFRESSVSSTIKVQKKLLRHSSTTRW